MAVVKGKRIIYLYRLLSEQKTAALGLAYTTENSTSMSRDSDTVSTKDGSLNVPKDMSTSIKATALFSSEGSAAIGKLKTAIKNAELVEVWEVNLDAPGTDTNAGKYESTYYQAYVSSYELTSNSEDHAEAAIEFNVNGEGVDGYATVSDTQKAIADLVFKDTTATTT
jgi:TP901-1 family phage major tail protein